MGAGSSTEQRLGSINYYAEQTLMFNVRVSFVAYALLSTVQQRPTVIWLQLLVVIRSTPVSLPKPRSRIQRKLQGIKTGHKRFLQYFHSLAAP